MITARPFYVEKKSLLVRLSALLMLASAAVRFFYYWRLPESLSRSAMFFFVFLPLLSNLLYAFMILLCGEERLVLTSVPVLLGCLFFIVKAVSFPWWHMSLCIALYLTVFLLYSLTVSGRISTQIPLVLVFALPLLFHLLTDPVEIYRSAGSVIWSQWLPELSVLLIMSSLLCAALAMKKADEVRAKKVCRWGDRRDGRLLRSLSPIFKVSPYIMKTRNASQNFIQDKIEITPIEAYIREKRAQGMKGFGIMHVLIAAYVRAVSQRPGINRFIGGQKIYARNNIEVVLTIKKEMKPESPDTVIKVEFDPKATVRDVYEKFTAVIEENRREGESSGFDDTARILDYIPGLIKKFVVWALNLLDYFGLLPRALTKVSPFHGSMYITSMGSLGIPPIYHHLYDFGNVPVFCAFGPKRRAYELEADGTVAERKYVDYTFVTDERICDGFYFASALKLIRSFLKNPYSLDTPVDFVVQDVE